MDLDPEERQAIIRQDITGNVLGENPVLFTCFAGNVTINHFTSQFSRTIFRDNNEKFRRYLKREGGL